MELLIDNIRRADEDNPNGYYEFERVKKLEEDNSWLDEAEGKAVKMVSMLLYKLPKDRQYKVVFMKRNLEELLASQRVMLQRRSQGESKTGDDKMGELFRKHLAEIESWLERQGNMDVRYIHYNEILYKPHEGAELITRFLGDDLDVEKMSAVVDRLLYRQRVDHLPC